MLEWRKRFKMDLSLSKPTIFSTESIPVWQRREWLCEVIGREYANVSITAPKKEQLFNEMCIYSWQDLRLSVIHSNAISIQRLPQEPSLASQDAYLGVILLSGDYQLEQNGREVFLKPGDITIYDATRPHRIYCPSSFSKLIVSIPRKLMHERLPGVEHYAARKVNGNNGLGAVASDFIQSIAREANQMTIDAFSATAKQSLDLFALALNSIEPASLNFSRSRSLSLRRIKDYVEQHLDNPELDTETVVQEIGLSARYINELFHDENTSLMRHVWQSRLIHCHQDLISPQYFYRSVSETALRWGFNDFSHFSRAFKNKYGLTPSVLKKLGTTPKNS